MRGTAALGPQFDDVAVVLYEPQDDINIGNTIRACKNFGITDIRLVRPASAQPDRISVSAPKADDIIHSMQRFDTLVEAVADRTFVVGTTARPRKGALNVLDPGGAASQICDRVRPGTVAILFGREDSGLPNEALDLCHASVTIPTRPDYASLNLGQAVLVVVWEVFKVLRAVDEVEPNAESSAFAPAPVEGVARMLDEAEATLDAIEFFKSEGREHILRGLSRVFMRAELDERELAILFGIFKEVRAFMERRFDYRSIE